MKSAIARKKSMSKSYTCVLASLILAGHLVPPVLAADDSQVNFKVLSTPKADASAPASSDSSLWSDDSSASSTATDSSKAASTTESSSTEEKTPAPDSTATSSTDAEAPAASTESKSESTETKSDGKLLQGYIRVVPSGTKVPIIMDSAVDSDTSQEGDEFAARTSEDLTIDGNTVVPAGSVIKGRIAQLNAPKHMSRSGSVALKFDTVTTPDNRQIALVANLVARGGVVHARRGMKDIAIDTGTFMLPTVLGVGIGALAGGSNNSSNKLGRGGGALVGAAVGAAIGVVILCAKKGKRVDVRPGDELKIELAEDLRMPM